MDLTTLFFSYDSTGRSKTRPNYAEEYVRMWNKRSAVQFSTDLKVRLYVGRCVMIQDRRPGAKIDAYFIIYRIGIVQRLIYNTHRRPSSTRCYHSLLSEHLAFIT